MSVVAFDLHFDVSFASPSFDVKFLEDSLSFLCKSHSFSHLFIRFRTCSNLPSKVRFLWALSRCYEAVGEILSKLSVPKVSTIILPDIEGVDQLQKCGISWIYFARNCTPEISLLSSSNQMKIQTLPFNDSAISPGIMIYKWVPEYCHSCLGGTFDHLHFGHKVMLTAACMSTKVILS